MQQELPNRRSIRLKGYDYSQAGAYFVTICTQHRKHFFGNIERGNTVLNEPGRMICRWWRELEHKFPNIQCDAFVLMPNHTHFIVIIPVVGAGLCARPPKPGERLQPGAGEHLQPGEGEHLQPGAGEHLQPGEGEHVGSPLPSVIQWFKTMTTNEYIRGVKQLGWPRFDGKLWQRNYWEHIIRNDGEYDNIREYIEQNPRKWTNDRLNGGAGNVVMESDALYGYLRRFPLSATDV